MKKACRHANKKPPIKATVIICATDFTPLASHSYDGDRPFQIALIRSHCKHDMILDNCVCRNGRRVRDHIAGKTILITSVCCYNAAAL